VSSAPVVVWIRRSSAADLRRHLSIVIQKRLDQFLLRFKWRQGSRDENAVSEFMGIAPDSPTRGRRAGMITPNLVTDKS
jgi:hypothetical protein